MAEGSRRRLAYVAESVWGTTPATPAMKTIRALKSPGIVLDRTQIQSQEMRSDRAIADIAFGNRKGSIAIPFELSYGSFDDFLEAALFGTWATNRLRQGTDRKSFTIEEGYLDMGQFRSMVGCMCSGFDLNIQPDAIITGNFNFLGRSVSAFSGTPLDASVDPATTTPVFNSFAGSLSEGGSPISIVTGLSLKLDNGAEGQFALFSDQAAAIGVGRANLSGSLSCYFNDVSLANKALAGTDTSLSITIGAATASRYTILIPRVKLSPPSMEVEENKIIQTFNWQALYDGTTQTCIQIDRVTV